VRYLAILAGQLAIGELQAAILDRQSAIGVEHLAMRDRRHSLGRVKKKDEEEHGNGNSTVESKS
jgi:hypothetical protein